MRVLERRPALYSSSHPVEEIVVAPDGGRRAAKLAPPREIAAYRDVLPALRLDTPAFVGARGDLLALEWVEGIPLWQSGDLADWEAAARWLARLHATGVAASPARFRGPAAPALDRLAAVAPVPIHGEFYPANVLVSAGRNRPLDFETFGLGAGALDIAALTAGDWPGDEPARIEAAYLAALPAHLHPTQAALADARELVALQCRSDAA